MIDTSRLDWGFGKALMEEIPSWCLKDRADLGKWREEKGKRAFQAKESLNKGLKHGQCRGEKASDER